MNPIKTKPPGRAPRIKTDAARAPKELMRRSFLSAREYARDVAEPRQPQDEQPEQYAEARIEHATANAAHCIGNETAYRGKRLMLRIQEVCRHSVILRMLCITGNSPLASRIPIVLLRSNPASGLRYVMDMKMQDVLRVQTATGRML